MNRWSLLLLVAALAVLGWYYRLQLGDFLAQHGVKQPMVTELLPPTSPPPTPPPTPNPASDAVREARKAYPALAMEGSAFNRKFIALYKQSDPGFLARSDWPLVLAERTARELGGGPMPIPRAQTPPVMVPLGGSSLDHKGKAGSTPVAIGSALDQPGKK